MCSMDSLPDFEYLLTILKYQNLTEQNHVTGVACGKTGKIDQLCILKLNMFKLLLETDHLIFSGP